MAGGIGDILQSNIRQRFQPRQKLADALMQGAYDTSPVTSPWEALGRVLQGGLAGYAGRRVRDKETEAQKAATETLSRALMGDNVDYGILGGNQDTAGLGLDLKINDLAQRREMENQRQLAAMRGNERETWRDDRGPNGELIGQINNSGKRVMFDQKGGGDQWVDVLGPDGQPIGQRNSKTNQFRNVASNERIFQTNDGKWYVKDENGIRPAETLVVGGGKLGGQNAQQVKAESLLTAIEQPLANVKKMLASGYRPDAASSFIANSTLGKISSDIAPETKQFNSNMNLINEAYLKALSGAASSDSEAYRIGASFAIQPGDPEALIIEKVQRMQDFLDQQRNAAGRGLADIQAVQQPGIPQTNVAPGENQPEYTYDIKTRTWK